MQSVVLIVYGVGGHKEEAERLMDRLNQASEQPIEFVGLCEEGVNPSAKLLNAVHVPHFRRKDVRPIFSPINMLWCSLCVFFSLFRLSRKYDFKLAISTGPGLAIPAFLWCKLFCVKTLYVESWCRFYQRSFSGSVCRFFADRFYFQNKTLDNLYPKGRWSGRL